MSLHVGWAGCSSGPGMGGFLNAYQMTLVLFLPQGATVDLHSTGGRERKEGGGSRVCEGAVVETHGDSC